VRASGRIILHQRHGLISTRLSSCVLVLSSIGHLCAPKSREAVACTGGCHDVRPSLTLKLIYGIAPAKRAKTELTMCFLVESYP